MPAGPVISRRRLLGGGAAAGAVLAADGLLASAPLAARAGALTTKPALSSLITTDPYLHLARRATYGITPWLHHQIRTMGMRTWIEQQLDPSSIDDSRCESYLRRYPLLGLGPSELRARVSVGSYAQMNQMQAAYFVRSVWSQRQLYEMMVEFWWNHFNIGLPDSDVWDLCGSFDDTIRSHALGRFDEMLLAVAENPAMLVRLNQNLSVGSNPNENYGREMLELHTVGVDAGYTQHDVHDASLLLTGWGVNHDRTAMAYTPSHHHVGPLQVMGFKTANGSATGGASLVRSYLHYLAHHPATASHLARELAVRFVSDSPPRTLVDRLAKTYLAHGTAISPVVLELLTSSEFEESVGKKVRRPIEAMAASFRVLDYALKNAGTGDIADVVFALGIMGQVPLGWPQPNGYPDTAPAWMSASGKQSEWGIHLRLTGGWWTKTFTFPGMAALLGHPSPSTPSGEFVDRVTERLLFQKVLPAHKSVLLGFLGRSAGEPIGTSGIAGLPMFAKLVLDSPYFAVR